MNQRIRELAEQARLIPVGQPDGTSPYMDVLNHFAELIVRECAYVVADAVDHREPASTYVGKIKRHFGVEE